jgi:hypothetical protein
MTAIDNLSGVTTGTVLEAAAVTEESEFRPMRTAEESVGMMASAEGLTSDFSTVRRCGSWRS